MPLAMMLFALSAQARDDAVLPPIGGSGGNRFVARCEQGEMLAGFDLRTGDDVDAIRPICTPSGTGKYDFYPLSFGGNGGGPRQLICPGDIPVVTGMDVGFEGKEILSVNNIHLFCGTTTDSQTQNDTPAVAFDGPSEQTSFSGTFITQGHNIERCTAGLVAVGINGRSGDLLDAVGLICGSAPGASQANAQQSDKPPPVALGRVGAATTPAPPLKAMGDEPPICARARDARARNSPVASVLETQCRAAGGNFSDRTVTQGLSGTSARNAFAASRVGVHGTAPPAEQSPAQPPVAHAPPAGEPAPADNHIFMPPLFGDGARLWACVDAAQGKKNGGRCAGMKAGRAYCRMQGFSGALRSGADGTPGLTLGAVRPENKVRAVNGDVCTAGGCVAISELHCAP